MFEVTKHGEIMGMQVGSIGSKVLVAGPDGEVYEVTTAGLLASNMRITLKNGKQYDLKALFVLTEAGATPVVPDIGQAQLVQPQREERAVVKHEAAGEIGGEGMDAPREVRQPAQQVRKDESSQKGPVKAEQRQPRDPSRDFDPRFRIGQIKLKPVRSGEKVIVLAVEEGQNLDEGRMVLPGDYPPAAYDGMPIVFRWTTNAQWGGPEDKKRKPQLATDIFRVLPGFSPDGSTTPLEQQLEVYLVRAKSIGDIRTGTIKSWTNTVDGPCQGRVKIEGKGGGEFDISQMAFPTHFNPRRELAGMPVKVSLGKDGDKVVVVLAQEDGLRYEIAEAAFDEQNRFVLEDGSSMQAPRLWLEMVHWDGSRTKIERYKHVRSLKTIGRLFEGDHAWPEGAREVVETFVDGWIIANKEKPEAKFVPADLSGIVIKIKPADVTVDELALVAPDFGLAIEKGVVYADGHNLGGFARDEEAFAELLSCAQQLNPGREITENDILVRVQAMRDRAAKPAQTAIEVQPAAESGEGKEVKTKKTARERREERQQRKAAQAAEASDISREVAVAILETEGFEVADNGDILMDGNFTGSKLEETKRFDEQVADLFGGITTTEMVRDMARRLQSGNSDEVTVVVEEQPALNTPAASDTPTALSA